SAMLCRRGVRSLSVGLGCRSRSFYMLCWCRPGRFSVRLGRGARRFHVLFRGGSRGFYALLRLRAGSFHMLLWLGNSTLLDLWLALRHGLSVVGVKVRAVGLDGLGASRLRSAVDLRGRVDVGWVRRRRTTELGWPARLTGANGLLRADRIRVNGLRRLSGTVQFAGTAVIGLLVRLSRTIELSWTTVVGLRLIRLTRAIELTWPAIVGLNGLDRLSRTVHFVGTAVIGLLVRLSRTIELSWTTVVGLRLIRLTRAIELTWTTVVGLRLIRLTRAIEFSWTAVVRLTRLNDLSGTGGLTGAVAAEASADRWSDDTGGGGDGTSGYGLGGPLVAGFDFRLTRAGLDAAGAVEAGALVVDDGNRVDVDVMDHTVVDAVDGAVVVEDVAVPVAALISEAVVAVPIVDAAVVADMAAPIAVVPAVAAAEEAPVAGCPESAVVGRGNPDAGDPVVAVGAVVPVAGGPYVVGVGGGGLFVVGQGGWGFGGVGIDLFVVGVGLVGVILFDRCGLLGILLRLLWRVGLACGQDLGGLARRRRLRAIG